jgi:outer membrane protein OmpU
MNKLTKIGVSALCGSLAAITSANAGSMSVAGGATATWVSNEGQSTGNPIGLNSGLTFTGTGELDNGTTFTLSVTQADQTAYSSSNLVLTVPGLGVIGIDQGAGGQGLDRLDDMMPTAWEETNGTGTPSGLQTVGGVGGSTNVEWGVSSDMLPDGLSVHLAYSPRATGVQSSDKATGVNDSGVGSGFDIVLQHSGLMDGLNVFAGMSEIEQEIESATSDTSGDRTQYAAGFTYAVGATTIGYQETRDNQQSSAGAATSYYDNTAYGVSFNVNDDLSISYGNHESKRSKTDGSSVTNDSSSLQIAYTVGGASIKFAETSVDNSNYSTASSDDVDGHTIALTLAF